jgi:hypothetical protein
MAVQRARLAGGLRAIECGRHERTEFYQSACAENPLFLADELGENAVVSRTAIALLFLNLLLQKIRRIYLEK